MAKSIAGIHHVTAIASDPQKNFDFYTEVLGLRLVKRTVNFDDPGTYHFYFADDAGTPGTILTFFPWPMASRGSVGVGQTSATSFSVAEGSLGYWEERLLAAGMPVERLGQRFEEESISFTDPDGMRLEIVSQAKAEVVRPWEKSEIPEEHALQGFFGVTLAEQGYEATAKVLHTMGYEKIAEAGNRFRFAVPGNAPGTRVDLLCMAEGSYGLLGAGSVHHVAFRAQDDADQLSWRDALTKQQLDVTPVLDRNYFHSIYFREPGGVLFEIATDPPGFAVDEPQATLGESLKLPEWLEPKRDKIEQILPELQTKKFTEVNNGE